MNELSELVSNASGVLFSFVFFFAGITYAVISLRRSNNLMRQADEELQKKIEEVDELKNELREIKLKKTHSDS